MSKQGNPSSDTDFNSVTVLRKKGPVQKTLKTSAAVGEAQRRGMTVETNKKVTGGTNKQHAMGQNAARLDDESEELHHDKIGLDVGRYIQQGRQDKEWTQKDLAQRINEKPTVVNEYESGKAVPNQQVLGKLERALGIKLRGKDKGQPLLQKGKGK